MAKKIFETLADLAACVGQDDLAVSDWVTITQEQINLFAEATGDHQWIHTDAQKALLGPFKTTIAHGFLTLSLIPMLSQEAIHINQSRMGINYGLNKVRFTSPVPVGSRLRARMKLLDNKSLEDGSGGVQQTWEMKIEREGLDKPVCIAETLVRRYP